MWYLLSVPVQLKDLKDSRLKSRHFSQDEDLDQGFIGLEDYTTAYYVPSYMINRPCSLTQSLMSPGSTGLPTRNIPIRRPAACLHRDHSQPSAEQTHWPSVG